MLTAESSQVTQQDYIKGSESFRLEYSPQIAEGELWNHVESYLGEYRFQVQKYRYNLFYTHGSDGLHVRGQEKGEALLTVGKRGVEDRHRRGEATNKVVADFLGMKQMEDHLAVANEGDTILYASPADEEAGYTYGFFYIGHVVKLEGEEKRLEMTAIRLDKNQSLDRYNAAIELFTEQNPQYSTVNEFIVHPQLIKDKHKHIEKFDIDFVLRGVFDFVMDNNRQRRFTDIINAMKPQMKEFIQLVQSGASYKILEIAFNALENYALELQENYREVQVDTFSFRRSHIVEQQAPAPHLGVLMQTHGFEAPRATGSCGSSGRNKKGGFKGDLYGPGTLFGNEILKDFSTSPFETTDEEDEYGSLYFDCPHCGYENKRPSSVLIENCQNSTCRKSVRC